MPKGTLSVRRSAAPWEPEMNVVKGPLIWCRRYWVPNDEAEVTVERDRDISCSRPKDARALCLEVTQDGVDQSTANAVALQPGLNSHEPQPYGWTDFGPRWEGCRVETRGADHTAIRGRGTHMSSPRYVVQLIVPRGQDDAVG